VVFESDDWGSIRMPCLNIRKELDKHPMINAKNSYSFYDTLASVGDVENLLGVLSSFRDIRDIEAVLTV
jgi:hypothetical protein